MRAHHLILRTVLVLLVAIALFGGSLQLQKIWTDDGGDVGRDNVHRFMAGIYFGSAAVAAVVVREVGGRNASPDKAALVRKLVFAVAWMVACAAAGRLISIRLYGQPAATYFKVALASEIIAPPVMVLCQLIEDRGAGDKKDQKKS